MGKLQPQIALTILLLATISGCSVFQGKGDCKLPDGIGWLIASSNFESETVLNVTGELRQALEKDANVLDLEGRVGGNLQKTTKRLRGKKHAVSQDVYDAYQELRGTICTYDFVLRQEYIDPEERKKIVSDMRQYLSQLKRIETNVINNTVTITLKDNLTVLQALKIIAKADNSVLTISSCDSTELNMKIYGGVKRAETYNDLMIIVGKLTRKENIQITSSKNEKSGTYEISCN